jgi:hypothetical protein
MRKAKTPSTPPKYPVHPIAACLPRLTPAAYAALKADIQARGQLVPAVLYEDQILDGRHRVEICLELGITPKFVDATGDPFLLVQSLNLHRRHLSAEQIAAFYKRVEREHPELQAKLRAIEAEAQDRQRGTLKRGTKRPKPEKARKGQNGPKSQESLR